MASLASKLFLGSVSANATNTTSKSYKLMLENSFISHSVSKGLHLTLPIGQRVVDKLTKLIEGELNLAGCQKFVMPFLGPKELWSQTDRWDEMGGELFRLKDRLQNELCLQPTGEEMVTMMVKQFGKPKKNQLPLMLYQTSDKFRDEMNPRFGWLRSRQFLMNDLYTFDECETGADETFTKINKVYEKIFYDRLGLQNQVYKVSADSGLMGGKYSTEYHLKNNSAEDVIYICQKCGKYDLSEDILSQNCKCGCDSSVQKMKTIEIGHTFNLGKKYSEALKASSIPKSSNYYEMCCFGIGVTRLIASCIDVLSPSSTILRLPQSICPFKYVVILPKKGTPFAYEQEFTNFLNEKISRLNDPTDLIIDDRKNMSVGKKIFEWNKMGIPNIIVVNPRTNSINDAESFEYFTTQSHLDQLQKQSFNKDNFLV